MLWHWELLSDAQLALSDYPVTVGILAGALVFVALHLLFPEKAPPPAKLAASIVPRRDMDAAELRWFNGVASEQNPHALIFVCVRGDIFNVTSAAQFYGASEQHGRPRTVPLAIHRVAPFAPLRVL